MKPIHKVHGDTRHCQACNKDCNGMLHRASDRRLVCPQCYTSIPPITTQPPAKPKGKP